MIKKIFILFLMVFLFISCNQDEKNGTIDDILLKLQALTGVSVIEIEPFYNYPRAFQIDILQPVDHNNPGGERFQQRIYLHHSGEALPMIMRTSGYTASARHVSELAGLMNANHMIVTHRYFIGAETLSRDWQYMNIRQSAGDHHDIVTLFKTIYTGKWVSTGHSKGGMTALFHKRFYPNDVDATVAYVAPVMLGLPDTRFDDYLANDAGDADCREKIKNLQKTALENRSDILLLLQNLANQNNWQFSIGLDAVLEFSVLEYWFYFFQYGSAYCSGIPGEGASASEIVSYLSEESPFSYYTDDDVYTFTPFYYQAFTELGYYYFMTDHLDHLLVSVTDKSHRKLAPQGVTLNYKPAVMRDILNWLQNSGNNIIYIYGGQDPYTIAAVNPKGSTNSLQFIQPGIDHGCRISDLTSRSQVLNTLESWLGVSVSRVPIRQIKREPIRPLGPLTY